MWDAWLVGSFVCSFSRFVRPLGSLVGGVHRYKGGLIVVSHDQYFVQRTCKELFVLEDKRVTRFDGDFRAYKKAYAASLDDE